MSLCLRKCVISVGLGLCLWGTAVADDADPAVDVWPQWRGPQRDGASQEKGLLQTWSSKGPPLAWKTDGLGAGYSSVAIAQGKIFTMGNRGGSNYVLARELDNGKAIWASPVGESTGDHPASTPTVDGEFVYAVGPQGDIACLQVADGKLVWQKSFTKDFGGTVPTWKFCESPLIDVDRVICTPGGPEATIVALDKLTGAVIWKCAVPGGAGSGAGYSSTMISHGGGVKQYVQLLGQGTGCVGISAADGTFLWKYAKVANGTATIPTPIVHEDYIFCSSGYGTGSALLQLSKSGSGVEAKEVYFLNANQLQNHHGGLVLVGDYVYGGNGHNNGIPTCVELKTGKVKWGNKRGPGSGSAAVVYADRQLYFRYEDGLMALIQANPKVYKLDGKFKIPHVPGADKSWAHPVVANGKLYLREQDSLFVYNVHGK
ncbi:MAG: PQQ-like beta-propeller repeat protein [Planctomycetes bacterium]|nr:PQQ-like beta-propeller repeat protein [Planctomycetota bacterium]